MHDEPVESAREQKSGRKSGNSGERYNMPDMRNQVTLLHREENAPASTRTETTDEHDLAMEIPCPYTIEGVCVVESLLSKGGMGTTYLGYMLDETKSRIVLKIPNVDEISSLKMFEKECQMLKLLEHQNIVPFRGSGVLHLKGKEIPYLLMKFISGQSLRQMLQTRGTLPWVEVQTVLENMLSALCCLHENALSHRDIKPDNIIYDEESGHWVLVDFGIAQTVNMARLFTLTAQTQDSGTWDYMAPEQFSGRRVDIRCDIYSLGKVVWELLMGVVPRAGTRLPSAAGVDVVSDVDVLISRMVEHKVDDRYQTPEEALQALRAGAGYIEFKHQAHRVGRRLLPFCIGSVVLAAVAGGVWVVGDAYQEQQFQHIADNKEFSALQKLKQVDAAASKAVLGWGNSWLNQNRERLEADAKKERQQCDKEWKALSEAMPGLSPSDRKDACQNFINSWESTYGVSDSCVAQAKMAEFAARVDLTDGADAGVWKRMYDELSSLKSTLQSAPVSAEAWAALQKRLDGRYLDDRVKQIDGALKKPDFSQAKDLLAEIRSVCGENEVVKAKISEITEAAWNCARDEIKKYMDNKGYAFAWRRLEQFDREYPDFDAQKIRNLQDSIFNSWHNSFASLIGNPDVMFNELKQFRETVQHSVCYAQCKQDIELTFSWALKLKINQMLSRRNSEKDSLQVQKAQLNDVEKWVSFCRAEHQPWFRDILSRYYAMCETASVENASAFNYYWERSPDDIKFKKDAPENFENFKVRIDSISVDMNGSFDANRTYFRRLKGLNNADPKLFVGILRSNGEMEILINRVDSAWVNMPAFEVPINKSTYIHKNDKIVVVVADDDVNWDNAPSVEFSVPFGMHIWTGYDKGCRVRINHKLEQ